MCCGRCRCVCLFGAGIGGAAGAADASRRYHDDGRRLEISPVESSHALESLTVTISGASPISVGSDGELSASDVESALSARGDEPKNRTLSVRAKVDARYVEMGKEKSSSGSYTLRYMWKGAGLFGGRSLHLVGLSRA